MLFSAVSVDPISGGSAFSSTLLGGSVQMCEELVEFKNVLKNSLEDLVNLVKAITGNCNKGAQ